MTHMPQQSLALPFEGARSQASDPVGGFPPKGYSREMPAGVRSPVVRADLTPRLPWPLVLRGCHLLQIVEWYGGPGDPFVLYDAWGHIIAEWETAPSLGELLGFC